MFGKDWNFLACLSNSSFRRSGTPRLFSLTDMKYEKLSWKHRKSPQQIKQCWPVIGLSVCTLQWRPGGGVAVEWDEETSSRRGDKTAAVSGICLGFGFVFLLSVFDWILFSSYLIFMKINMFDSDVSWLMFDHAWFLWISCWVRVSDWWKSEQEVNRLHTSSPWSQCVWLLTYLLRCVVVIFSQSDVQKSRQHQSWLNPDDDMHDALKHQL